MRCKALNIQQVEEIAHTEQINSGRGLKGTDTLTHTSSLFWHGEIDFFNQERANGNSSRYTC